MFKNLTMDSLARPYFCLCAILVGQRFSRRGWEHKSVAHVQLGRQGVVKNSAPGLCKVSFAPVCYRQVRNLALQGADRLRGVG